ncbi:hypothetical protein ED208_16455 [Stagnimonas aquatica]|uniref:Uncharacterized protein n=1 Tax=Stagnimonas aquatica TaxID=2689987 RepID=A0A3N0UZY2_9GAMM|nr:hypothetical protein ED208_16455 [Stagnimonas aquatica]
MSSIAIATLAPATQPSPPEPPLAAPVPAAAQPATTLPISANFVAATQSGDDLSNAFASAASSQPVQQIAFAAPASVPPPAAPSRAALPGNPIYGNTGPYLCPFTEDGTVTPWVEKALKAKLGGQLGGTAGAFAGQKLAENVPFLGGLIGKKVGQAIGKQAVLQMMGGWEAIRASSEISFASSSDMALYLKTQNSSHPQYREVLDSAVQLYPDLAPLVGLPPP